MLRRTNGRTLRHDLLHPPPASVYLLTLLLLHRPLVLAPAKANLRQVLNHVGFPPTGCLSTRTQAHRALATFFFSCTIPPPIYELFLNLVKAKQQASLFPSCTISSSTNNLVIFKFGLRHGSKLRCFTPVHLALALAFGIWMAQYWKNFSCTGILDSTLRPWRSPRRRRPSGGRRRTPRERTLGRRQRNR